MPLTTPAAIRHRLAERLEAHHDLDLAIARLGQDPLIDALALRRLKKRKLQLKDEIFRLEMLLVPDEPA